MEHATRSSFTRRRFVLGVTAVGVGGALAGCQDRLRVVSPFTTPAPTAARKPQPPTELAPPSAPVTRIDVDYGRIVRLEGVTVGQERIVPGEYLRVWLHWLALSVSQDDLRSLGRVVAANGRVVAKEDDQIGRRKNYLSRWKPYERHVDEMRLRIAPSTPGGEYALTIAVLRPDNQTHVPIHEQPSRATLWGEDSVIAGTIELDG